MQALVSAFGIDWRLLLIDGINFGLLLLALWYFLYGPLTAMLEARRQKVAQGVRDAEEAQVKLHEIEAARGGILANAGQEADELLKKARIAAQEKERTMIATAEAAAARTAKEAQMQALELKAQAIEESKQELAKLVVLGMEKMMTNK
jgi:F-type H+-transporting ATPase subunit b